jgi:hypothetical protein
VFSRCATHYESFQTFQERFQTTATIQKEGLSLVRFIMTFLNNVHVPPVLVLTRSSKVQGTSYQIHKKVTEEKGTDYKKQTYLYVTAFI